MIYELKACPFCGGPAEVAREESYNEVRVMCKNDSCRIQPVAYFGSNEGAETHAVNAWNERQGLHVGPFKIDVP